MGRNKNNGPTKSRRIWNYRLTQNRMADDGNQQIQQLLQQAKQAYDEFESEMAALRKKQQEIIADSLKKQTATKIAKIKKQISDI